MMDDSILQKLDFCISELTDLQLKIFEERMQATNPKLAGYIYEHFDQYNQQHGISINTTTTTENRGKQISNTSSVLLYMKQMHPNIRLLYIREVLCIYKCHNLANFLQKIMLQMIDDDE